MYPDSQSKWDIFKWTCIYLRTHLMMGEHKFPDHGKWETSVLPTSLGIPESPFYRDKQ